MSQENIKAFEAGETIFRENDSGSEMYILRSGAVELRKKTAGGETLLKTIDQPNGFFGEMALVDGKPRSATAVAVRPCSLLVVTENIFENMILTNGEFALKVIKILTERIRASNVAISELVVEDVKDRFFQGAVDYANQFGVRIFSGGMKVNIEDMMAWIVSHVGLPRKEADLQLARALRGSDIQYAPSNVKTMDYIVISEPCVQRFDRRHR